MASDLVAGRLKGDDRRWRHLARLHDRLPAGGADRSGADLRRRPDRLRDGAGRDPTHARWWCDLDRDPHAGNVLTHPDAPLRHPPPPAVPSAPPPPPPPTDPLR